MCYPRNSFVHCKHENTCCGLHVNFPISIFVLIVFFYLSERRFESFSMITTSALIETSEQGNLTASYFCKDDCHDMVYVYLFND